jgi:hypothetical protein
MKTLKFFLVLTLLIFLLSSCDNAGNNLTRINPTPMIQPSSSDETLRQRLIAKGCPLDEIREMIKINNEIYMTMDKFAAVVFCMQ